MICFIQIRVLWATRDSGAVAAVVATAFATDNHLMDAWTSGNGLPDSFVTVVAQMPGRLSLGGQQHRRGTV
jgi:hypothetical protein